MYSEMLSHRGVLMATNEERKQKTSQKILDVATRCFMHHGVKATSIAEIAKMAGVSQVTLYKHYKNKETLARAAVIKLIDDGYRQDLKILADTTLTFKEKMGRLMQQSIAISKEIHPDFYQYIVREFSGQHGTNDAMRAYEAQRGQFWGALLQQGRDTGEIDSTISNSAVLTYLEMFVQFFVAQSQKNDPVAEKKFREIGPELDQLFFYGLIGH